MYPKATDLHGRIRDQLWGNLKEHESVKFAPIVRESAHGTCTSITSLYLYSCLVPLRLACTFLAALYLYGCLATFVTALSLSRLKSVSPCVLLVRAGGRVFVCELVLLI